MQHFLISSADRTDGTSDFFTIDFIDALDGKYLVKYLLIPNTLYNVHARNNVVPYFDALARQVVIPPGSYTGTTLAQTLKTLMDAASAPTTFTVTYSSITGKLTFVPSAGTLSMRFGTFPTNAAAQVLGFPVADTVAAASVTSPTLINLSYPTSLALLVKEAASWNIQTPKNEFFHIYVPFDVAFGYYRALGADVLPQALRFLTRTRRLTVQVLDSAGNPISLNNGEFEILLQKC